MRGVSIGVICLYKAQAWLVTKMLADAGFAVGVNDPGSTGPDAKVQSKILDHGQGPEDFDYDEGAENGQHRELSSQNQNNGNDIDNYGNGASSSSGQTGRKGSASSSNAGMSELRVSTVDAFQVTLWDFKVRICASQ